MAKFLAVFGATGQQGGSVVNYVLNDPELSRIYKIRAITRNVNSIKAQQLKDKVEVVQGDVSDQSSIEIALTGAHTIFAMTTPALGPDAVKGAACLIFSTLPSITEISGGKYTAVTPFDAKAKAEQYIRSLPIQSEFYCPGPFMENFQAQNFCRPRPADDGSGTWVLSWHISPTAQFALIDVVGDSAKFVGAILADPDSYEGKTFHAAAALYTLQGIVEIMSKVTGKTIVYRQIPVEEFKQSVPPFMGEFMAEWFSSFEEFGFFGLESEELVAWAVENARGRLSIFEEYLEAHPFRFE